MSHNNGFNMYPPVINLTPDHPLTESVPLPPTLQPAEEDRHLYPIPQAQDPEDVESPNLPFGDVAGDPSELLELLRGMSGAIDPPLPSSTPPPADLSDLFMPGSGTQAHPSHGLQTSGTYQQGYVQEHGDLMGVDQGQIYPSEGLETADRANEQGNVNRENDVMGVDPGESDVLTTFMQGPTQGFFPRVSQAQGEYGQGGGKEEDMIASSPTYTNISIPSTAPMSSRFSETLSGTLSGVADGGELEISPESSAEHNDSSKMEPLRAETSNGRPASDNFPSLPVNDDGMTGVIHLRESVENIMDADSSVQVPLLPGPLTLNVAPESMTAANQGMIIDEGAGSTNRQGSRDVNTFHGANVQICAASNGRQGRTTPCTTADYGKLLRLLRLHGYANRAEIEKTFPNRSYEDVLVWCKYFFPAMAGRTKAWDEGEIRKLFSLVGRAVDWNLVAGEMRARTGDEVRNFYNSFVRGHVGERNPGRPNLFQN